MGPQKLGMDNRTDLESTVSSGNVLVSAGSLVITEIGSKETKLNCTAEVKQGSRILTVNGTRGLGVSC